MAMKRSQFKATEGQVTQPQHDNPNKKQRTASHGSNKNPPINASGKTVYTVEQMMMIMEQERLSFETQKEKLQSVANTVHWPTFVDGKGYRIKFPSCEFSGIIRYTSPQHTINFYAYLKLYPDWPNVDFDTSSNRSGKLIQEFFDTFKSYCLHWMKKEENIALTTYVEKLSKCSLQDIDDMYRQPEFPQGHERAFEVDESKSPSMRCKLWEGDANKTYGNPQNQNQNAALPRLVVENGQTLIFTRIYDMYTKGFDNSLVTTPEDFYRFVSSKEFIYPENVGLSNEFFTDPETMEVKQICDKQLEIINIPEFLSPSLMIQGAKKVMQYKVASIRVLKVNEITKQDKMSDEEKEELIRVQQEISSNWSNAASTKVVVTPRVGNNEDADEGSIGDFM